MHKCITLAQITPYKSFVGSIFPKSIFPKLRLSFKIITAYTCYLGMEAVTDGELQVNLAGLGDGHIASKVLLLSVAKSVSG